MDIYVYNEKDNEQDILQHVERACTKMKLDRSQLGQHVWTSGINTSLAFVITVPKIN